MYCILCSKLYWITELYGVLYSVLHALLNTEMHSVMYSVLHALLNTEQHGVLYSVRHALLNTKLHGELYYVLHVPLNTELHSLLYSVQHALLNYWTIWCTVFWTACSTESLNYIVYCIPYCILYWNWTTWCTVFCTVCSTEYWTTWCTVFRTAYSTEYWTTWCTVFCTACSTEYWTTWFTVPSKSKWLKCKPVKLRATGQKLHWQEFLSVGFARDSQLYASVSWLSDVRHSMELERHSPAYYVIICAGQI